MSQGDERAEICQICIRFESFNPDCWTSHDARSKFDSVCSSVYPAEGLKKESEDENLDLKDETGTGKVKTQERKEKERIWFLRLEMSIASFPFGACSRESPTCAIATEIHSCTLGKLQRLVCNWAWHVFCVLSSIFPLEGMVAS